MTENWRSMNARVPSKRAYYRRACGMILFLVAVMFAAVSAMSASKGRSLQDLSAAIKNGSQAARISAIDGLTLLGSDKAAEAIQEAALTDKDPEVREAAYVAFYSLRKRQASYLLLECLKDSDDTMKPLCVRLLGKLGAREAIFPLIGMVGTGGAALDASIMETLGKLGSIDALPFLAEQLQRPLPDSVKVKAVEALGSILEDSGAIVSLERQLKPGRADVQAAAALALAKIGNFSGMKVCLKLLAHQDKAIRVAAAAALGEMEAPDSLKALQAALEKESDPQVKKAILIALNRVEAKR